MGDLKDFKWLRPPYMLAPYTISGGIYTPDVLVEVYNKLKSEDLYQVVFHDNPAMNILEFMNFFNAPSVSLQIVNRIEGNQIKEMAGLSWLAALESYGGNRQRAVGSFCVFKDYQSPNMTDPMSKMVLDYWYDCLGLDIIVAMTPAANVLALRFIKRLGFQELCRIPGYSAFLGEVTDSVITAMNKDRYKQIYGG